MHCRNYSISTRRQLSCCLLFRDCFPSPTPFVCFPADSQYSRTLLIRSGVRYACELVVHLYGKTHRYSTGMPTLLRRDYLEKYRATHNEPIAYLPLKIFCGDPCVD